MTKKEEEECKRRWEGCTGRDRKEKSGEIEKTQKVIYAVFASVLDYYRSLDKRTTREEEQEGRKQRENRQLFKAKCTASCDLRVKKLFYLFLALQLNSF